MWVMNYLTLSNTYATIVMLHQSPICYLIVLFCVSLAFVFDFFIASAKFNLNQSPSDYLREQVKSKTRLDSNRIDFFY